MKICGNGCMWNAENNFRISTKKPTELTSLTLRSCFRREHELWEGKNIYSYWYYGDFVSLVHWIPTRSLLAERSMHIQIWRPNLRVLVWSMFVALPCGYPVSSEVKLQIFWFFRRVGNQEKTSEAGNDAPLKIVPPWLGRRVLSPTASSPLSSRSSNRPAAGSRSSWSSACC